MEQIGFADFGLVHRRHGAHRGIRFGPTDAPTRVTETTCFTVTCIQLAFDPRRVRRKTPPNVVGQVEATVDFRYR